MDRKILFRLLWSCLAFSAAASAQPVNLPQQYKLVGQASFSWLWFDVYHAQLATPTGRYQFKQVPFILSLNYARSISSEDLVAATQEDWQRQKINYQQNWLDKLATLWPDVQEGDQICLYIDSNGHSHFYFNQQYRGTITDLPFAAAIAAIWLSANTQKPELTQQLIGE